MEKIKVRTSKHLVERMDLSVHFRFLLASQKSKTGRKPLLRSLEVLKYISLLNMLGNKNTILNVFCILKIQMHIVLTCCSTLTAIN